MVARARSPRAGDQPGQLRETPSLKNKQKSHSIGQPRQSGKSHSPVSFGGGHKASQSGAGEEDVVRKRTPSPARHAPCIPSHVTSSAHLLRPPRPSSFCFFQARLASRCAAPPSPRRRCTGLCAPQTLPAHGRGREAGRSGRGRCRRGVGAAASGGRCAMAASVFCCLRCCRDGGTGHIPLKEMPAVQLDTQHMGKGTPFPTPNGPRGSGAARRGQGRGREDPAQPSGPPRPMTLLRHPLVSWTSPATGGLHPGPGSVFKAAQPSRWLASGGGVLTSPCPPRELSGDPRRLGERGRLQPQESSSRAPVKTHALSCTQTVSVQPCGL